MRSRGGWNGSGGGHLGVKKSGGEPGLDMKVNSQSGEVKDSTLGLVGFLESPHTVLGSLAPSKEVNYLLDPQQVRRRNLHPTVLAVESVASANHTLGLTNDLAVRLADPYLYTGELIRGVRSRQL